MYPISRRPSWKKSPRLARKARERQDKADAFIKDPGTGPAHMSDDLAESLAEKFIGAATSAEEESETVRDAILTEETGGPFIITSADLEFAEDADDSNPLDAEPEAFPVSQSQPQEQGPEAEEEEE